MATDGESSGIRRDRRRTSSNDADAWSTGEMSGRLVFVEDSLARATEIRRLLDLYRSGLAERAGERVPAMSIVTEEYWDPDMALARLGGDTTRAEGVVAEGWDSDDLLFMDCWDRDSMDATVSSVRSTFFALDLLRALRSSAEAGRAIPRVIVHSRGMKDDLLRAALSEFTVTRRKVRRPGATPVVRWRLDASGDTSGAVIWAMFDRTDLERNLDRILVGDRTAAMAPPGPDSVVWAQIQPTSCLASFHCAIRDESPDVWDRFVIGRRKTSMRPDPAARGHNSAAASAEAHLDTAAIARVTRTARRYLELNDAWGARGYKGYLAIARALANPES